MLRWAVLLAFTTFVVWRYVPRVRVTWLAVVTVFVVVVATRAAISHWA
ncbi:MAG: hypothetical protein JJD92_13050 [Frankiaceae bacterium]|nr:hypothetical protein [Frankiaceae bacterium]